MKRYKRILVPVDGSKLSKLAFENALSLAKMIDGNITVMHVHKPVFIGPTPLENINLAAQTIDTENRNRIDNTLKQMKEQGRKEEVKVRTKITNGNVANEIIEESSNYDLIIMGSLGESALAKLFLGSIAEKVSRHACCPVMLVKEQDEKCSKDNEDGKDEKLTKKIKEKMELDSDLDLTRDLK